MTDAERVEAWRLLVTTHRRLIGRFEEELARDHDLPIAWYDVLLHLYEAEGNRLRMHELADNLLVSRSALSRFIDKVETAGLVERIPADEDGRGTYLTLTDRGTQAFMTAGRAHRTAILDHFGRHLTDTEVAAIRIGLARVLDA